MQAARPVPAAAISCASLRARCGALYSRGSSSVRRKAVSALARLRMLCGRSSPPMSPCLLASYSACLPLTGCSQVCPRTLSRWRCRSQWLSAPSPSSSTARSPSIPSGESLRAGRGTRSSASREAHVRGLPRGVA
eukprot:364054-Chlamydomonas_euryale.AAC.6